MKSAGIILFLIFLSSCPDPGVGPELCYTDIFISDSTGNDLLNPETGIYVFNNIEISYSSAKFENSLMGPYLNRHNGIYSLNFSFPSGEDVPDGWHAVYIKWEMNDMDTLGYLVKDNWWDVVKFNDQLQEFQTTQVNIYLVK